VFIKNENCVRGLGRGFFILPARFRPRVFFFTKGNAKMNPKLIKNTDESKIVAHKIARLVRAETNASSLAAVEALTSMIANRRDATRQQPAQIIQDTEIFHAQSDDMPTNESGERGFQMCLRAARRMLNGDLPDSCCGATRFHRSDTLPEWAVARGYIAEIDGLMFYL
jgi:hypothetical protein